MENNEQKHLALIAEMINTARQEFSDRTFIYLLWGWAVCVASLGEFLLIQMKFDGHAIVWVLMPLAAVLQVVLMSRQKKKEQVKTHVDKVMRYVWTAIGVSLAIVLFSGNILQSGTYPVLIMLYGIGTFISGGLMNLKPMMAGAICCWVIAFVAFHLRFEHQLLMLALSVMVSYIIPGHILKSRFRKNV